MPASRALIPALVWGLAIFSLFMLWMQGVYVPLWGDDYIFLLNAEQSRLAGEPWFQSIWPDRKDQFWRPLGEDIYWRFIEGVLGGDSVSAHVSNLLLLVCMFFSVSWFANAFAGQEQEGQGSIGGLAAGFFFTVHASHFLPIAHVSAANSSIVTTLVALSMGCWFKSFSCTGIDRMIFLGGCILTCTLALLSKEIAAALPLIMVVLSLAHRPLLRFGHVHWITLAMISGLVFAWLVLRHHLTEEVMPQYTFEFSQNILRNAASLLAFFLNVPREALRFVVEQQSLAAVLWGLSCLLLQGAAVWNLYQGAKLRMDRLRLLLLCLFFAISCVPYFLFAWNCYAYYISIGLLAFAIPCALAIGDRSRLIKAALLAFASSALSTIGNHTLDYPSLLGRAKWSERQLGILEEQRSRLQVSGKQTLYVVVDNEHLFSGIGPAGLAYRLGIPISRIAVKDSCADLQGRRVLRVRIEGDMEIATCPAMTSGTEPDVEYTGPEPNEYTEGRLLRQVEEIASVVVARLRLPVDGRLGNRT